MLLLLLSLIWMSLWIFALYIYPTFDGASVYSVMEVLFYSFMALFVHICPSVYFLIVLQCFFHGAMFLYGYHWYFVLTGEEVTILGWDMMEYSKRPMLLRLMYIDLNVKGSVLFGLFILLCGLSLLWLMKLVVYLQDVYNGRPTPFPTRFSLFRSRFDQLFHNDSCLKEDCSICLCAHDHTSVTSFSCGHSFHASCITNWLEHSAGHCPLCNQVFVRKAYKSYRQIPV
jgi:hypothetical protein